MYTYIHTCMCIYICTQIHFCVYMYLHIIHKETQHRYFLAFLFCFPYIISFYPFFDAAKHCCHATLHPWLSKRGRTWVLNRKTPSIQNFIKRLQRSLQSIDGKQVLKPLFLGQKFQEATCVVNPWSWFAAKTGLLNQFMKKCSLKHHQKPIDHAWHVLKHFFELDFFQC